MILILSSYWPDWTAATITLLLAVLLSIGVKESSRFNNIFTLLNLGVVFFVIIAGMTRADSSNWSLVITNQTREEDPRVKGEGGFFPFGLAGKYCLLIG